MVEIDGRKFEAAAERGGPGRSGAGAEAFLARLLSALEPAPEQLGAARAAVGRVADEVARSRALADLDPEVILAGSWARGTALAPQPGERLEVDAVVLLRAQRETSPRELSACLEAALAPLGTPSGADVRRLRLELSGIGLILLPALAPDGRRGTLYRPARTSRTWRAADPLAHAPWAERVDRATAGRFRSFVRLLKGWRRENPTVSRHPTSFVLECLVAALLEGGEPRAEEGRGRGFVGLLGGIVGRYGWAAEAGIVPTIADPAVPGGSVTEEATPAAFEGFVRKVNLHWELGVRALERERAGRLGEADALWRRIFGSRA